MATSFKNLTCCPSNTCETLTFPWCQANYHIPRPVETSTDARLGLTTTPAATTTALKLTARAVDRDGAIARVTATNPFRDRLCPEVELPIRPNLAHKPVAQQLRLVQRYISSLQYNFVSHTFFDTAKYRPLSRILDTAREIVRECLPIRCLEAAFVALLLTQELPEVDRIPLAFRSAFGGATHRHIVVLIRHAGVWGALGLSRRADLMHRPLMFDSLGDIIVDFKRCYESHGHRLEAVFLGLPVSHDPNSVNVPCWKYLELDTTAADWGYVE